MVALGRGLQQIEDGAIDGFVFDRGEQSRRSSRTSTAKRVDRDDTLQQERTVQVSTSRAERFTLCVAVRIRNGRRGNFFVGDDAAA